MLVVTKGQGFAFDPAREPYRMLLGSAEEWTVYNSVDNKLPRHAHSFHIHVNPCGHAGDDPHAALDHHDPPVAAIPARR